MSSTNPITRRLFPCLPTNPLALAFGLVGAGVFTTGQGNAVTGVINAVLTAFGVVAAIEWRVTPISDPHDAQGRPLTVDNDDIGLA